MLPPPVPRSTPVPLFPLPPVPVVALQLARGTKKWSRETSGRTSPVRGRHRRTPRTASFHRARPCSDLFRAAWQVIFATPALPRGGFRWWIKERGAVKKSGMVGWTLLPPLLTKNVVWTLPHVVWTTALPHPALGAAGAGAAAAALRNRIIVSPPHHPLKRWPADHWRTALPPHDPALRSRGGLSISATKIKKSR